MKRSRFIGVLLPVLVLTGSAFVFAPAAETQDGLSVADSLERTVVIPARVERVLSLQPEITRLIAALGAADRLVGIDYFLRNHDLLFRIVFPGQDRLPLVSMADYNFNPEYVVRLAPQVIFGAPEDRAVIEALQNKTRIPIVALSSQGRFDGLLSEVRLLGRILGRGERASELETYLSGKIARIRGVVSPLPPTARPRVYLSFWGVRTQTPVFYEPVNAAGGINVAENLAPLSRGMLVARVDFERILTWNPDVILVHGNYPPPSREVTPSSFLNDSRLHGVRAVRSGRVFYTFGFWNWWDPAEAVLETAYLARLFHPSLFPDFDLESEGNAVFKAVYGIAAGFTALSEILDCRTWIHERS